MSVTVPPPTSGPPAGVWRRSRIGMRVGSHLLRLLPLRAYGQIFPRRAIGLCYHVVSDLDLPHVRHLYRYKNTSQFEADLLFLKRNFRIVSYDELEAGGAPNGVVITFDDGLAECFSVVRPLLLKLGVPCTFFVSPPHLDNQEMFSFDRASLALDALHRLDGPARAQRIVELGERVGAHFTGIPDFARWLTSWIRTLTPEQEPLLDEICAALGVDVPGYLERHRPYLTREQVRTLAADGFTIGGHGLRHTALGAFPAPVVTEEIVRSCAEAAALSGRERVPFAFPFDANGVDRALLAGLRERHPEVGLLFNTGPLGPDREFMINRMIVDVPASVAPDRSNLAGYLRGMYLTELLRIAGGRG